MSGGLEPDFINGVYLIGVLAKRGAPRGEVMIAFIRRLFIHYDIYRRYPLARVPALRNAWRIARP
jgi:hypothetical protein